MNKITLHWLLEKTNPSVRYFTLRHLLDRAEDDAEVQAARRAIMRSEPVKAILAAQDSEGWWAKPGVGYSGKYRATTWQLLFLAEFGADGRNRQIRRAGEYVLSHSVSKVGGFSASANAVPSGVVHCLNGNLVWALVMLGWSDDERLAGAVDWIAGAATGEDFSAFYDSATSGPGYECAVNDKLPCAWGTVKVLRALNALPPGLRSPRVEKARDLAVAFLLSRDLAKADYPAWQNKISGEWFRFGFPLSYTSDVLEALLALAGAGAVNDPRAKNALDLVESKRGPDGRWALKHSLNGKMWADVEKKGQPSKWVTLRALRLLKAAGE